VSTVFFHIHISSSWVGTENQSGPIRYIADDCYDMPTW